MSHANEVKSIAGKFFIGVFFLVLVLGLLFAGINGYISYIAEIRELEMKIFQIQESHIPFLVSSLWLTDDELVTKQIESIVRFPYIERVEIVDDESRLFNAGTNKTGALRQRSEPLTYEYKGAEVPVGTLTIFINYGQLQRDVLLQQLGHIIAHVILAVFTAVFVSAFFQLLIGRHLRGLARKLRNDRYEDFDRKFQLDRRSAVHDELAYLASSLNSLRLNLKKYIDDKELLLHEVHHRIKNNMVTLMTILHMQSDEITNPEAKSILEETEGRLQSMTILYDKLYRSKNLSALSAGEYLPELAADIVQTFAGQVAVTLESEVADIDLPVKILSSIGIILNELITNSIKHSFKKKPSGKIFIQIASVSTDTVQIEYRDDGDKIPSAVLAGDSWGLGMLLIHSFAEQIGSLRIDTDEGNRVTITSMYVEKNDGPHV